MSFKGRTNEKGSTLKVKPKIKYDYLLTIKLAYTYLLTSLSLPFLPIYIDATCQHFINPKLNNENLIY
jgi:hypothetical protein